MASLNKVMLIGHLGRDAELRYSANGTGVLTFSLATRRGFGEKQETDWHNAVMFGERAVKLAEYLTKGKLVYIDGQLRSRSWDDNNGVRHYRTDVVVDDLQFLGGRNAGGQDQQGEKPKGRLAEVVHELGGVPAAKVKEEDLPWS